MNKKELSSFLGLASFYRNFSVSLREVHHLTQLTKEKFVMLLGFPVGNGISKFKGRFHKYTGFKLS